MPSRQRRAPGVAATAITTTEDVIHTTPLGVCRAAGMGKIVVFFRGPLKVSPACFEGGPRGLGFPFSLCPSFSVRWSTNKMSEPSIQEKKVYESEAEQYIAASSVEEGDVVLEQEAAKALRK